MAEGTGGIKLRIFVTYRKGFKSITKENYFYYVNTFILMEDDDIEETMENFECPKSNSEDETLKSCTDVQITNIFSHEELGRGTFGVLFPVVATINGRSTNLAVKKIQVRLKKKVVPEIVIHDLYYEVENSYNMGKLEIGPIVYDAFYTRDAKYINQYIIMEKMDISVRKWIELDPHIANFSNSVCQTVTQGMLNLMYKQIFVHQVYCVDIKADNYLINFKPLKIRMIDFGADWCQAPKLPSIYITLPELKQYSREQHKEIFYAFNALQLYLDLWRYLKAAHQNKKICKWILMPFYADKIFNTYIIKNGLHGENLMTSATVRKQKLSRQRSLKRRQTVGDMKQILLKVLESGRDQGITLRHYLKDTERQSNEEIVTSVYKRLEEIPKFINAKN